MKTEQPHRFPRWMVLITTLLDIALGYLSYNNLIPGKSVESVIRSYHSFYEPAGYSFLIWSMIYFFLMVYAFYQLAYAQRNEIIFDRLAKPLIQLNLLAMAWVILARLDLVIPSVLIIVWMFVVSIVLYVRVRDGVLRHDYNRWISVPFSLYSGWLLIMAILTGSILL
ncbi:MAG TPA: hypothetical protein VFE57_05890, partial [Cyclobacteriaceae bacterium]|nr:hypothetical protein [Cyclobacteriaceae bacterium]